MRDFDTNINFIMNNHRVNVSNNSFPFSADPYEPIFGGDCYGQGYPMPMGMGCGNIFGGGYPGYYQPCHRPSKFENFLGMAFLGLGIFSMFKSIKANRESEPNNNDNNNDNNNNSSRYNDKGIQQNTNTRSLYENSEVTELGDWSEKAEKDKDAKPFIIAGEKFQDAIKSKDETKIIETYRGAALSFAKDEIAVRDLIAKDGALNDAESISYDNAHGKNNTQALNKNIIMDLNNDGKVDEKEYAAYLNAVDANNSTGKADGKITRDEYLASKNAAENKSDANRINFRESIVNYYNKLFGTGSNPK